MRLSRSAHKWEVMIFCDRQTHKHCIIIYIIIILVPNLLLSWVVSFIPNTIIITIYGLNGYDYRSTACNDKEDRDPDLIRQPEDIALTSDPKAAVSSEHRSSYHTSNHTKGSIIQVSSEQRSSYHTSNHTEACNMQVSYKYPPNTVYFLIKYFFEIKI